jgi:alkyl sulfatase BDS1-like metallo-beta-lactamase superfamily hydrolase
MQADNYHRAAFRRVVGVALLVAAPLLAAQTANAQLRTPEPKIIKVTDRVYVATGYALANLIFVVTDDSVVIVDTTESMTVAADLLGEIRKVTDKPISHIIYTHFHGDHINGARALAGDRPQIIAQKLHTPELEKYQKLMFYNQRLNAQQFGASLPPEERGISLALEGRQLVIGYVPPTRTFDDQYAFEAGGVRFELYHAPGETLDHLFVWLPGEKVLMPGDLYYASFPMLASPMKPDRPIIDWAQSLERMRELHAESLVPSHSEPVIGAAAVDDVLKNYAAAIRYLNDETIKGLNAGKSLEQLRQSIKLPRELADKPYLQPLYGRIEWAINGAYRNYTGWYDFNPTHLNPGPEQEFKRALVEVAGGPDPIVSKAEQALGENNYQLVLELTDVALTADPKHVRAHAARATALEKMAAAATSGVEKNIYRAAAKTHREKAATETAAKAD